jgi:hypothetical protein
MSEVFQAAMRTLQENGYPLAQIDPAQGILLSDWRPGEDSRDTFLSALTQTAIDYKVSFVMVADGPTKTKVTTYTTGRFQGDRAYLQGARAMHPCASDYIFTALAKRLDIAIPTECPVPMPSPEGAKRGPERNGENAGPK